MQQPLKVWQSGTRVTSNSGTSLIPADGYSGPLLVTELRPDTLPGEDGLISNVTIDQLHLDGMHRSKGLVLRHVQLSVFRDLHIRNTNGAALRVSDFCIENLFNNLVLSDSVGNFDEPALWIQPENTGILPLGEDRDLDNITVNSTFFSGIMIHFQRNDALRISAAGTSVGLGRRHRKIQFLGCFFHGRGEITRPLITLEDSFEISISGCQLLSWTKTGTVLQLGAVDSLHPVGSTMISHCNILGQPGQGHSSVGIRLVNVEEGPGVLSVFGNNFGSHDARLGHAVDWGTQLNVKASWAANLVNTEKEPHLGKPPLNADASPF